MLAQIPVLSADCAQQRYAYFCRPFTEMILADRAGNDTCNGDSGGPVYARNPTTQKDELVAIVSRSLPLTQGSAACGGGGIYELLAPAPVRQWLADNGVPDTSIKPTDAAAPAH